MTLLASTTGTFVSGSLISYFAVWAFMTSANAPGSVAYEFPCALLTIFPPSISVDVA